MPKKKASVFEARTELVRRVIRRNMADRGILYMYQVSDMIGMEKRVFQRRMKNPEDFTLEELWKVADALKFSPEDRAAVLI